MSSSIERLTQDVGQQQADIKNIKEDLASMKSKPAADTLVAQAELRIAEKITSLVKDFSLTKIDRIKFYAIISFAAASFAFGGFWHFRGEMKTDVKDSEMRMTQKVQEAEDRLSKQMTALSQQIASSNLQKSQQKPNP